MTQKLIRYNVTVRHLQDFERGHRKTTYIRFISSYESLDDAIDKLIELTMQEDPTLKSDIPVIIEEIKEDPGMLLAEEYSVIFEKMNDYMPDEKKWYWGPGAFTIKGSPLQ